MRLIPFLVLMLSLVCAAHGRVPREADLSQTEHGAGGVGGLVSMTEVSSGSSHFAAYDGNGNVVGLVNASSGRMSALYEYGPFGEPLRATGPMAALNPIRFSSKFTDNESGLLYYGYRFYNPSTGRWLNRDPIEELGGLNLYGFNENSPLCLVDPDGAAPQAWVASAGYVLGGLVFDHLLDRYAMPHVEEWIERNVSEKNQANIERIQASLDAARAAKNPLKALKTVCEHAPGIRKRIKLHRFLEGPDVKEAGSHASEVGKVTGVVDRAGAAERRAVRMKGRTKVLGKDLDEFPPAVIKPDDATKVSIKAIDRSQNRRSGARLRGELPPDGTPVEIVPD